MDRRIVAQLLERHERRQVRALTVPDHRGDPPEDTESADRHETLTVEGAVRAANPPPVLIQNFLTDRVLEIRISNSGPKPAAPTVAGSTSGTPCAAQLITLDRLRNDLVVRRLRLLEHRENVVAVVTFDARQVNTTIAVQHHELGGLCSRIVPVLITIAVERARPSVDGLAVLINGAIRFTFDPGGTTRFINGATSPAARTRHTIDPFAGHHDLRLNHLLVYAGSPLLRERLPDPPGDPGLTGTSDRTANGIFTLSVGAVAAEGEQADERLRHSMRLSFVKQSVGYCHRICGTSGHDAAVHRSP